LFQYNDIAILTMDSPVTFTHQVRPICLPTGSTLYSGITGTVIGWGSLREGVYATCLLIPLHACRTNTGSSCNTL